MKYKIGDEVRIKELPYSIYKTWPREKVFFMQTITKIIGIDSDCYLLACDEKKYYWREEWLASINYTCRTCGKVFHTKHGYYVHKALHKCGRINDEGILDERFKKKTSQTMMEKLMKNYGDNGVKMPKNHPVTQWHYERIGDMTFMKNFGVPIGSINDIHKVLYNGKRVLLANVKDLTPEGQYCAILDWLYTHDKVFNSSQEWKTEFSSMLRTVLKLKKN